MSPRYFRTDSTGRDRWMVSYMDVLTILLIFFVALAAQGLQRRETPVAAQPPAKQSAPETNAPDPRRVLIQAREKLEQQRLDTRLEPRGLVISLPQAILFASGDDRVSAKALPLVAQIAGVLREIPNEVSLVGHADPVPIHNRRFQDNWDLAAARGLRLLELLSRRYGIQESRLSVASYGPYHPNGTNDTPDGRALNRRVEIIILEEPPATSR